MPQVIIHIGLHKTATTTIQNSFETFNSSLSKMGIHYPIFCIGGKNLSNHSKLFKFLCSDISLSHHWNVREGIDTQEKLDELIKSCKIQLKQALSCPWDIIIFSGEGISIMSAKELYKLKTEMDSLLDTTVDYKIVCCTRGPLSLYHSTAQYRVQLGNTIVRAIGAIERNVGGKYRDSIEKFVDLFGKESLIVYKFEDMLSSAQGPFNYFLGKAIPEFNSDYPIIDFLNEGYCQEAIEIVSRINTILPVRTNGKRSLERYKGDVFPLSKLKGQKFKFSADIQKIIIMAATEDRIWLKEKFGINYSDSKIIENSESFLWREDLLKQLQLILPSLNDQFREIIIDYCRDLADFYENRDSAKARRLMDFYQLNHSARM